jgi:hypothetical protein
MRSMRHRQQHASASLKRRTRFAILVMVIVVVGALASVAVATNVLAPDLTTPSPTGDATTTPASVASAFPILKEARQPADILPAAANMSLEAPGTAAAHYGVNPALSHFAGELHGEKVWLVPGATGTCIWVAGAGAICASNAVMTSQGGSLIEAPLSGASSMIGVTPEGTSVSARNSTGSSATVATNERLFYVAGEAPQTQVVLHTAAGEAVNLVTLSSHPGPPGG